jgi:hypothetical protein
LTQYWRTGSNDYINYPLEYVPEVVENQRLLVLDISLKDTPSHWWGTHKENINNWFQCKRLLHNRFDAEQENMVLEKYDGFGQPKEHVDKCTVQWRLVPLEEWPHHFIHTLEDIPKNWY